MNAKKSVVELLAPVMEDINRPGTCESAVNILERATVYEQTQAAMKYSRQFVSMGNRYKRFIEAVPEAVQAAQDNIELEDSLLP